MTIRQKKLTSLRLRNRQLIFAAGSGLVAMIIALIYMNVGTTTIAEAATPYETMDSGSFIVNNGIVPQTYNNGLKPYGLVYDLIANYDIQVKWVIDTTKAKDAKDFTYNGVDYKGGPFIIPATFITSTVKTRITYWLGQGISGIYTTAAISVPVYSTLTCIPRITVDNSSGKESIIEGYFTNAGIPLTSIQEGLPDSLSSCHDLWINPHGDPTWTSHNRLYNFAIVDGSFIWSECHATSVMESVKNPSSPFQQLNFLTTNGLKCYSNNKCVPAVNETHAGNPNTPETTFYPGDPIMQFMGYLNLGGGSETWYIPASTGSWRPTTKRCVVTADGTSPGEGVEVVYGPVFGLANKGYAMYEASHDLDGNGSTAEKVAAQRIFFNYLLFASNLKSIKFTSVTVPSTFTSAETKNLSVSVNSGNPTYAYQWTSTVAGGTFSNSTNAGTTYKAPSTAVLTKGVFTCKVTDACGRKNFINRPFVIDPNALPVSLTGFTAYVKEENKVQLNWITASEKDNDFFTIERSADGIHFNELKQVDGAGNSNEVKKYSCIDEQPIAGNSYYRLKQTDFNGKTETFKTVAVSIKTAFINKIRIYPNPFSTSFTAEFESDEEQEVTMQLLGLDGKEVHAENIMVTQGHNTYRFEVHANIRKGTYLFRLINEKAVFASARVSIEE